MKIGSFHYSLFFLFSLTCASSIVQAQKISLDSVVTRSVDYIQKVPQEKAYLRTNKEVFTHGEILWFAAYLLDAVTHTPANLSTVLYVDLMDPAENVLSSISVKLEEGRGNGDFLLADSLLQGVYHIRAYTQYMKNFQPAFIFTRPIKLLDYSRQTETEEPEPILRDIDIQFFPEGGNLIAGQLNYVAFKAINEKGVGISLSGKIVDEKGEELTSFEEVVHGMGKFQLNPEKGHKYFATYEVNSIPFSRELPSVKDRGFVLNIRQTEEKVYITLKASNEGDVEGSFIIGHNRGTIFAVLQPQAGQNFIYAPLPADQIPSGISHFTFFDSKGRPRAERLVFNYNDLQRPDVTVQKEPERVGDREKVGFDLNVLDAVGNPVEGDFSVSVLSATRDEANKINIENYLLMSSDLTGSIEHPEWYFNPANENQILHRDLIMMTNGWRRFQWEDVLNRRLPPVDFFPERGFSIEGRVVKYLNRDEGVKGKVELSFLENLVYHQEAITGEDGTFWFDGLEIVDTMTTIVKTVRLKEKDDGTLKETKRGSYILIRDKVAPDPIYRFPNLFEKDGAFQDLVDNNLKIRNIDAEFDDDILVLDEVQVEAKRDRRDDPFYRQSALYRRPSNRLVLDSVPMANNFTNIFDLIKGRVPGVNVIGSYPNQRAVIRGGSGSIMLDNDALFLVDGIPADPELVSSIPPQQVEFIDVLKGPAATLYSSQGRGVIAIYLRQGPVYAEQPDPIGFISFTLNGYYPPRKFYVPQYDQMSLEEKVKPDYRSTLFWNPKIAIKDGKAGFTFFNSDEKGDFIIYIEGMTSSGLIINQAHGFTVD